MKSQPKYQVDFSFDTIFIKFSIFSVRIHYNIMNILYYSGLTWWKTNRWCSSTKVNPMFSGKKDRKNKFNMGQLTPCQGQPASLSSTVRWWLQFKLQWYQTWLTLSKISRTLASDSPNHMVRSSGPLTEMKLAWHSLAIALASSVLPHPGGP